MRLNASTRHVIRFLAICMLPMSSGEAQENSGFYLTLDVTKENLSDIGLFEVDVEHGAILGTTLEISLLKKQHDALEEAIFEKRSADQRLLLEVPVEFANKEGEFRTRLVMSDSETPQVKIRLYFAKAGAADVLSDYYQEIPENCLGVCYVMSPGELQ